MSKPEHLNPLTLVINLINTFISFYIFGFTLFVLSANSKFPAATIWGVLNLLASLIFIYIILKYFFTTYQITEKSISMKSGIFFKKEKTIPYSRIQAVHERQPFIYQPFNLTHVGIDTANRGTNKAELDFPVISQKRVELIEQYRMQNDQTSQSDNLNSTNETETTPAMKNKADFIIPLKSMFQFALTDLKTIGSSIFTVIIFENLVFNDLSQIKKYLNNFNLSSTLLLVSFFILIFVISISKTFLQFFDYQLSRNKNNLIIETGLFQRKTQTIPVEKIQNIYLETNFIRRWIHQTSLKLTLAGSQSDKDNVNNGKIYLFPIIRQKDAINKFNDLIPEIKIDQPNLNKPTEKDLHALWLFWRWNILIYSLISLLCLIFYPVFAIIPLIILIVTFFDAMYDVNHQGIDIQRQTTLAIQKGFCFGTKTIFFSRKRIQDLDNDTTILLYRVNRGHITFNLLNGSNNSEIKLRFIPKSTIENIDQFYRQKTTN